MKRAIALAVLGFVLTVATPGYAQPKWGVIGGWNSASLSGLKELIAADEEEGELVPDPGRRNGFMGGIFVNVPLANALSVQPAVVYTQNGATLHAPPEDGFGLDLEQKIDYVTIPIPFRYDVGSRMSMRPFVQAGPYLAFKTSAKTNYDFHIDPSLIDTPAEREAAEQFLQEAFGVGIDGGDADLEDVKSFDFGIVVGGGVQLTNRLGVGVDFSFGLTNINDDEDEDVELNNRAIALYLTYGFGGR